MEEQLLQKLRSAAPESQEFAQAYLAMFNLLSQKLDAKSLKKEACRAFGRVLDTRPDWEFTALGKVAYLVNRNVPLRSKTRRWLDEKLEKLTGKQQTSIDTSEPGDFTDVLVEVINRAEIDGSKLDEMFRHCNLDNSEAQRIQSVLSEHFAKLSSRDLKRTRLAERSEIIRRRWTYEAVRKQLESLMRHTG